MPDDRVTLDVFLVTVQIPSNLPDDAAAKARRTLNRATVSTQLRQAVATHLHRFPALSAVTVSISR